MRDDDRLIERIRARAWDPVRRLGHVGVPFSAVLACTADPSTAQLRENLARAGDIRPRDLLPQYMWTSVAGGSLTAVEYYRDAPHEPPRPPLSPSDVDEAERRMGVALPPLLRRVYTEVGDGGFGPEFGLPRLLGDSSNDGPVDSSNDSSDAGTGAGLDDDGGDGDGDGGDDDGGDGGDDGLPMVDMYQDCEDMPTMAALGLPLCDHGCGIWDWVSLQGPGYAVRRLEVVHDPESDARALLRTPGIPLVTWFERWLG